MADNYQEIYTILERRFEEGVIKGLYLAVFDDKKDKFFAATYVPIELEEYEQVGYHLDKIKYSSNYISAANRERSQRKINDLQFQYKSTDECIAEGIYVSYLIAFTGILYRDEWYIMPTLTYIGEGFDEFTAKAHVERVFRTENYWQSQFFVPYKNDPNNDHQKTGKEYTQFGDDVPYLVAIIKKEKKEEINRAYCRYMNEAVFLPLSQDLKINFPDDYISFQPLWIEDFTLLFPESKKYAIMVAMACNKRNIGTIVYFLHDSSSGKIFEWLYPDKKEYDESLYYGHEVVDVLKEICAIDNDQYLAYKTLTIDEASFWENYVFKKENGEFLYLKEINMNRVYS